MKIKNRKHHKKCFQEKTLREVSKGKITKLDDITITNTFKTYKEHLQDFEKNQLKLGTGMIKSVGKSELLLKDFLEGFPTFLKTPSY